MGPAVQRTRPQSRITAAPVQPKSRSCGCSAVQLRAQSRLRGTEFLDAETKRQKSPLKCANACRDQSPGSKWPEIPRRSALFGVDLGKGFDTCAKLPHRANDLAAQLRWHRCPGFAAKVEAF